MSNVISLINRLPSAAPLADPTIQKMHLLRNTLGALHRELETVIANLAKADCLGEQTCSVGGTDLEPSYQGQAR